MRAWPPNFGRQQTSGLIRVLGLILTTHSPKYPPPMISFQRAACKLSRTATASATTALKEPHLRSNHIRLGTTPTISTAQTLVSETSPLHRRSLFLRTLLLKLHSTKPDFSRRDRIAVALFIPPPPFLCATRLKRTEGWTHCVQDLCGLYSLEEMGWMEGQLGENGKRCQCGAVSGIWCSCIRREMEPRFWLRVLVCRRFCRCSLSPNDLVRSVSILSSLPYSRFRSLRVEK